MLAITDEFVNHVGQDETPETLSGQFVVYALPRPQEAEGSVSYLSRAQSPTWSYWNDVALRARLTARLTALADLGTNWDSYGAAPIESHLLQRASQLLSHLLRQGVPLPSISPSSSGSLELNWRGDGIEVEIDLDPMLDDLVTVRINSDESEYEGLIERITGRPRIQLEEALSRIAWLNRTVPD